MFVQAMDARLKFRDSAAGDCQVVDVEAEVGQESRGEEVPFVAFVAVANEPFAKEAALRLLKPSRGLRRQHHPHIYKLSRSKAP